MPIASPLVAEYAQAAEPLAVDYRSGSRSAAYIYIIVETGDYFPGGHGTGRATYNILRDRLQASMGQKYRTYIEHNMERNYGT